jgi:hypothetical protein
MSNNGITEQVEDALTYPILTQQVDSQPSADTQVVPGSGGASIDSIAQSTNRRVLGWRYRAGDTKGFTAALTKTFALKEVEGHVEWEWKPQNYMVQADLGEVTGAQASIYSRAKVALDQILPLLDGLMPLREDADPEDCEAIRSIIRNELNYLLVPELVKPGGPRVQLVQQVFDLLLGPNPATQDPENVKGQLAELKDRFGLKRKYVNTVDEEVTLTNFLIIVDYINSLYNTWQEQAKYLGRQNLAQPFLGTQLVLLSQQFEVVADSVYQAYDAMDSVLFRQPERETTQLSLDGEPWITVAELLKWVEDSATVVFPQAIQDGGKDGVSVVFTTSKRLFGLVDEALQQSRSSSNNPVRGFHTARTQRAFEEIRSNLSRTQELASEIPPIDQTPTPYPTIVKIDPPNGPPKSPTDLTITVKDIPNVAKAYLLPKNPLNVVTASKVNQSGPTVNASFDLGNAKVGDYTLILETGDGDQVSLESAFTIQAAPPNITSVQPSTSDQEDMVRLDIGGTGFQANATVTLELAGANQKPEAAIVFLSGTHIVAEFDLSSVIEGTWTLVVTNPDGQKSNPFDFQIVLPPPVIQSFVPEFGTESSDLHLTVRGQHFRSEMTVALRTQCGQTQIDCDNATVVGSNIVTATFAGSKLTAGDYYVIVTNPGADKQSAWSEDCLKICKKPSALIVSSPPVIESFVPPFAHSDKVFKLTIYGKQFEQKAHVSLRSRTLPDLDYGEATFQSSQTVWITIDPGVLKPTPGKYYVVIVNPDGGEAWSTDILEIEAGSPAKLKKAHAMPKRSRRRRPASAVGKGPIGKKSGWKRPKP